MNKKKCVLAVIGVGNMAKSIINGIVTANIDISQINLYDKNTSQYSALPLGNVKYTYADSVSDAVTNADYVLLSVKPQNYPEVLIDLAKVEDCNKKIYISIGAGITSASVSEALLGASVIRVLPNVPMFIGQGVSVICESKSVSSDDFNFVCSIFKSAGNNLIIDESDMNRIIGVTSSSPAYVFKFIDAIYQGAIAQGLPEDGLLDAICDVVIGSAMMLKQSSDSPCELVSKVASKGGTTEQALLKLNEYKFDEGICEAMKACTRRADELGKNK